MEIVRFLTCNLLSLGQPNILKWVSLVTLTLQNAVLSVGMRYARTQPGELFLSSTAVVMSEIVKLASCVLIIICQERSVFRGLKLVHMQVFKQPIDTLKVKTNQISMHKS